MGKWLSYCYGTFTTDGQWLWEIILFIMPNKSTVRSSEGQCAISNYVTCCAWHNLWIFYYFRYICSHFAQPAYFCCRVTFTDCTPC